MDQSQYDRDNLKNCIVESPVPEITKTEPCQLGIDEAGRGPVLGPMVYGICYSPLSEKEKLKKLGLADSKTLSEEQRDDIFGKICDCNNVLGWMVEILSPTFISNSMLRRAKYNLNALSHDCAIGLIKKAIERGANIAEVYVDTVGDPVKYQNKLKEIFPNIDITVAKKADSIYPIVSGASICAKVARDQAVKNWKFGENLPTEDLAYGSGYPGDAVTKQFLATHIDRVFGFPQFVRISWSTASQILDKEAAPVKWEDDEDDVDMSGSASLLTFFQRSGDEHKHQKHKFFVDRSLSSMATL